MSTDFGNSTLRESFQQICRIAAETIEVERVGVWLYSTERDAIRCACLYERSRDTFSDGVTLLVEDFPEYFSALEERKAIPAEAASHDPRTAGLKSAYLDPLGITSLLDAPIFLAGRIVGVVCHEHTGPLREWTTEERDFAGSMADFVALKMKGA